MLEYRDTWDTQLTFLHLPMKMEQISRNTFLLFFHYPYKKKTLNVINRSMIIEKKTKWKKSDNADDKTHLFFVVVPKLLLLFFIPSGCCISVWLRFCSDVSHTTSSIWSCNVVGASLCWIAFPLHTPGSTSNNRTTPKCTTRDASSVRWGCSCVPSCSRPWHARRSFLLLLIASFHNLHPSEVQTSQSS